MKLVPITEAETAALMETLPIGETLPLAWGTSGVAIESTGDGSARWALATLAELRGIDLTAPAEPRS